MKLKDLVVRESEPLVFLQIKPDRSVRNYQVETLAKAFIPFRLKPIERIKIRDRKLVIQENERFTFEIHLSNDEVSFYISCPQRLEEYVKQTVRAVWEKATIVRAEKLPLFDPDKSEGCFLIYKRHDIFAINTDSRTNKPMPLILSTIKDMDQKDQALIQFVFEPVGRSIWERESRSSHKQFQRGEMPRKIISVTDVLIEILRYIGSGLGEIARDLAETKQTNHRRTYQRNNRKQRDQERSALLEKGLSDSTKEKPTKDVLDTWIRVISQSEDRDRRIIALKKMTMAFQDLAADNELVEKKLKPKELKVFIHDINERRPPSIRNHKNRMSTAESGKLMQIPTAELQDDYPQISSIRKPEVTLPNELFLNVKAIDIGDVSEKGEVRRAKVPLEPYQGVKQKDVDDAYNISEFIFGEPGAGKTGESIHRAVSAIKHGQTVFFFDTADGQATRDIHDALPEDYPEDKIVHLDLTNKAWPIALGWGSGNQNTVPDDIDDFELELEKAKETARTYLKQFVSGMAQSEFTDRMGQYLASASNAVGSHPLDIELALTSPAFREELLSLPHIQAQPEVVKDLEALQDKAKRGSDDISVEGIISRLRKLSSDKFRSNLFHQEQRLDVNGNPPLDFRKFADNNEGGYGYCVTIYCDKTSFGPDGQEAIMTFMFSKVLLEGAYSRVDIDQNERKSFVVELDEPHRFIKGEMATKLGEDAAVELRKYRCKLVMFGHTPKQLGKLWDAFASGGVQVTMYKSKDVDQFKQMREVIHPLDPVETFNALPEKWEAVVTKRLPSGKNVAFIAKMCTPPEKVKDRGRRRAECSQQFGRHWKEVQKSILDKKLRYQEKDSNWIVKELAKEQAQKEAERDAKREARKKKNEDGQSA